MLPILAYDDPEDVDDVPALTGGPPSNASVATPGDTKLDVLDSRTAKAHPTESAQQEAIAAASASWSTASCAEVEYPGALGIAPSVAGDVTGRGCGVHSVTTQAAPSDRDASTSAGARAALAAAPKARSTAAASTGAAPAVDSDDVDELLSDGNNLDDFQGRRRRAVFTAMLLLLDHGARDPEHLSHVVAPMSGDELQQVAEERALAGRCGNPLCDSTHPVSRPPPRRRWDPSDGFIEPPPPSHFCSASCELLVESYARQLGDPLERLKPGVRQLLAASHAPRRPGMEDVAAQGGGVATMMSEVRERDPEAAAVEAVAGGRELDKLAAAGGGAAAAASTAAAAAASSHRAVEGYIPGVGKRRQAAAAAAAEGSVTRAPGSVPERQKVPARGGRGGIRPALVATAPAHDRPARSVVEWSGATAAPPQPALKPSLRRQSGAGAPPNGPGGPAAPTDKEQKRVTFGPQVEYQLPADPSPSSSTLAHAARAAEQPVLVFNVDDEDRGGGDSAGGGQRADRQRGLAVGPMGTLRVAESAEVMEAVGETETLGGGLTDEELAESMREKGTPGVVPQALRLWFPPSAGGVGVGKRAGTGAAQRRQQPPQAARSHPAEPTATSATFAAAASWSTAVTPASSDSTPPAAKSGLSSSSSQSHVRVQTQTQTRTQAQAKASAQAQELPRPTGLRRFMPQPSQRRKVVFLDKVEDPGGGAEEAGATALQAPEPAAEAEAVPSSEVAAEADTAAVSAAAGAVAAAESAGAGAPPLGGAEQPKDPVVIPLSIATSASSTTCDVAVSSPGAEGSSACGSDDAGDVSLRSITNTHASSAAVADTAAAAPQTPSPSQANAVDPRAPWAEPPPGAAAGLPTVHVVHVRSDKRSANGGVAIPPECQPYFPEEEGEDDEEEDVYDDRFAHDDRDADEVADDLYAGTLRAVDEEEEEAEAEAAGRGEKQEQKQERHGRSEGKGARRGEGCEGPGQGRGRGRVEPALAAVGAGGDAKGGSGGGGGSGKSWWKEQLLRERRARGGAPTAAAAAPPPPSDVRAVSRAAGAAVRPALVAAPDPASSSSSSAPSAPGSLRRGETTIVDSSTTADRTSDAPSPTQPASQAAVDAEAGTSPPTEEQQQQHQQRKPQTCENHDYQHGQDKQPRVAPATASASAGGTDDDGGDDPSLEPWMQRDDLDSSSVEGDDDDDASNASSTDDYNYKAMLPFFRRTNQHYHTVLSPYNQVQMALVGWINSRTVAFVVGIGLGPLQDPGPALDDAAYALEGPEGVPDPSSLQARGVLLQLLAAPLRECCSSLGVKAAHSDVDRKMAALVSTFRLSGPIPGLKSTQWHLLALALLHALSRHHIPAIRASLCSPTTPDDASGAAAAGVPALRAGGGLHAAGAHPRLVALVQRIGFDVHYLGSLVDLLVSPDF